MAAARGVTRVLVHAFLDGRDTPPKSAAASIRFMEAVCAKHPGARIATVTGRYYAMDRDRRWERVKPAYDALFALFRRAEKALAPISCDLVAVAQEGGPLAGLARHASAAASLHAD